MLLMIWVGYAMGWHTPLENTLTFDTARPLILLFALTAALAIAPVAPEVGNILFLSAAAVSLFLMRKVDLALSKRPLVWMPLTGLILVGLAYGIATSAPAGVAGIFYFTPLLTIWPLMSLTRDTRQVAPVHIGVLALCGAAGCAAVAISEVLATGTTRAGGSIANPIHFADIALGVAFLALVGTVYCTGAGRWLFLAAPVAASVAVLLSGTRGAVLALAVMTATAIIGSLLLRLVSFRLFAIGALGGLLALVLGAVLGAGETSGWQRVYSDFATILNSGLPTDFSTAERLLMYEGGLRAFLASPVFGHGPFDFVEAAASRASLRFDSAPHLHNDLADFGASGGLMGLAAYFLFLLAPLVEAWRAPPSRYRAGLIVVVTTLVVGYFVMGLTNAMFGILNLTVFFAAFVLVTGLTVEEPFGVGEDPIRTGDRLGASLL
jgi:O-antigen ligase